MEILGRSIPNLQNAIVSGLDSVTSGIAESTKASGAAALGIAQQSFSFDQMGMGGTADLPVVSGAAEYPEPARYFRQFSGVNSGSTVSSLDIARTLTDVQFSPDKSLQTLCSKLNNPGFRGDIPLPESREDMHLRPESLMEQITAFVEKKQREIERKMFDLMHPKTYRVLDVEDRRIETDVTHPSMDPSIPVSKRLETGPSIEGSAGGGTSNAASNRSIIVVGGKAADASDRSIIVVGGKTSDTYLETIDDSLNQLRQSPTRLTADLFRQQFGAVQGLITTAQSAVQLQQKVGSNLLSRDLRI